MADPNDTVTIQDSVKAQELSIAELLKHQQAMALSEQTVTSAKCLHVAITNKEELAATAAKRSGLRAQALAEGYDPAEVDAPGGVLDKLVPHLAVTYRLADEDEADIVLVHAGHGVTARELSRYGLTPADVEVTN